MTSMSLQQITVPFHNAELYIVEHEGQPYTPMKPIVDGMGLDWKSQFVKLKQRFIKGMVEITIPTKGGLQTMLCLMLRKLPAWLYSVNANKVKPELRSTVIKYQEECDDVLWDYWTKGQAVNPRTTKVERTPLHDAHAMLVAKTKHLSSSDAWKLILQRFDVKSIKDIPYDAIPVAVEYVHHLIALYSNADKKQPSEDYLQNVHALATHMIWVREWWRVYGESIKKLNPTLYSRVVDHFTDGSCLAWRLVKSDQKQKLENCVRDFDWITGTYQQKLPI
ncbi:phage antirepressor N-terminal domain-containing protein [Acinetobacter sp. CFCC 10889]|uniref:phage antirepressor N-terminal domain-containing protein n=1 Tax=Acinetobacter sp. CFCC 10889 TaxID=1775557 RepID=UPI000DD0229F|nr:phage antirepressor N-terminal domain-containing protein [Acinetobacter sp. CFCC 10889]